MTRAKRSCSSALRRHRPEQLLGRRELGEQPLEVAAAERLRDGADERALRGAGRAEEQDVLAGEDGARGAVDDVFALGEARHEVGAQGCDLVHGDLQWLTDVYLSVRSDMRSGVACGWRARSSKREVAQWR